jgi:transglutaminase-like putative cysteine protease
MRFILLIIFLFTLQADLKAQHNFTVSPTPDWLAPYKPDLGKTPDASEVSNGYFLLLLEEQHHAEKDAVYRHIIRQIVSEAGIQNGAEISVDYDPTYEKLHFHQLIIRRNGAVINKLDPARFRFLQKEDELSRFIYSGTFTAYYILDDVRKGDQIEYAYTLEGANPIFEHKYANTFYFTSYDPIVNYYKALIAAPSRDIRFKPFNHARLPTKTSWKGMQLYEWKIADVMPADEDDNAPEWYNNMPFVQASEYKSWAEIINWGVKINTPPAPGTRLQTKIAELKKQSGDNKALYLQNAMRFVQDDIRYMGIEMGEYSHRPNNPDKIIDQRFGDCKDKSLLLTTLLQADGINASMAYTNTYLKAHVSDYLPSPYMFNHVIVYATLGDSSYWIDPTISYQRGPLSQHTVPDYQEALIIKTDGSNQLTAIPQVNKGKQIIKEHFTLPDTKGKKGKLTINSVYTLRFADQQRDVFANNSMKDQQKAYLDYYKNIYGEMHTDSALKTIDDPINNQFSVIERYVLEEPWKNDSDEPGRLEIPVTAGILQEALPKTSKKKNNKSHAPLALHYPYELDYTIDMDMPIAWSLSDEPIEIRNEYYAFSFRSEVNGTHVSFHYTFVTFQDNIPAHYLAQYESDRNKMDEAISFSLFWTPGDPAEMAAPADNSVNWLMVSLAVFFLAFFARIAWKYNQYSIYPVQEILAPAELGGFLLVIGFFVFITPLGMLQGFFNGSVFSFKTWYQLGRSTNIISNTSFLQLLFLFRTVAAIFFFVYSILLIALFLNRRDTFPNAMVYFMVGALLFTVIDAGILHYLYKTHWEILELGGVIYNFVKGLIFTPYLLQSAQVKETFIMPHRSVTGKEKGY